MFRNPVYSCLMLAAVYNTTTTVKTKITLTGKYSNALCIISYNYPSHLRPSMIV